MDEKKAPLDLDFVEADESNKTNWKAVYIAGIVSFLGAVENNIIGIGEWPYLHTIDQEATSSFFGIASSIAKWGHVLFSILFSIWTYKSQTVRWQLIVGRILALAGCCIYLSVEFLPTNRRFLMLGCYLIFSVAASSAVILRVYLVLVSSEKDRSKAFATTALSGMLSIIIGPENNEFDYSLEAFKKRIQKIRSLEVCWSLVVLCLIEKVVMSLSPATLGTVGSPIFMATFGWNGEKTVRITSITMGAVGFLSIIVALLFMVSNFTKWVPSRVCFLIGICISISMYISSYPYPLISHTLPEYNATSRTGCNPDEYSWCETAKGTWPIVFIPVVVGVMGLAMPLASISIDTIYSKVVNNADQSIMQGMVVVAEDITMVLAPLYSAIIFTLFGQAILWMINGALMLLGVVAWFSYFPRLSIY